MGEFTVPKVVKFVKREQGSLSWVSVAPPVALDKLDAVAMMRGSVAGVNFVYRESSGDGRPHIAYNGTSVG
jgi:hypothetical protein